jgi:glycosyltransferase involved in cell wall biosynthesis
MFQKRGWEVHIITSGIAAVEEYKEGIYIHEVAADEQALRDSVFSKMPLDKELRHVLAYSYAVYKRLKKLVQFVPVDIVDQSLWGMEGLITRIKLPHVPMLTRVDTTTRLIHEINDPNCNKEFSLHNQLEQFMLLSSDLLVFNSWSIMKETERLYETSFIGRPYAIIHHGIEPEYDGVLKKSDGGRFRILVPGRLEKRKGTYLLIQSVLPALLAGDNDIEVHFVGKDNADWDGFRKETGFSYTEFISNQFSKELNKRLFLHGYVPDEKLEEHYAKANCVLAPSLYESFGLVYLEAAKFKKPLVALDAGAVSELFENGKEALLVPVQTPNAIVTGIMKLKEDSDFTKAMVANATKKLHAFFHADTMTSKCMHFIEGLLKNAHHGTVYQLMNALTVGDGVSTFARDYDYLYKANGQATQIMGNHCSEALNHLTKQIHEFNFDINDSILYHYCGCCEWSGYINSVELPTKILFFHNITPPHFFQNGTSEYASVVNGWMQLPDMDNFDLYVALSQYSLNVLQQSIPKKLNTFIMPMLVDKNLIRNKPYSVLLTEQLRQQFRFHMIFVGRVWPHKKQLDLVKFAHYYKSVVNDDFHISIIGGGMASYIEEVKVLIKKYGLEGHVTIVGKVTDEDLYAYYRAADVYLSMSEHEGFGTPLAEAMVFDVPVVAYGVTAIPETVGDNGCIFYEKNYQFISTLISQLYTDPVFRQQVIEKQHEQLNKYSEESVCRALQAMQRKSEALHAERLNNLINANKLFDEDFLNYKDSRLIKKGEWRVADGRTLINYGHDQNSWLEVDLEFAELDLFFVTNEKSGMVAVYLNSREVLKIDLYAPTWVVRKYTIASPNTASMQNVKIVPLGEKNTKSSFKEVLVYGLKAKRRYRNKLNTLYTNSVAIPLAG